jgi:hypothetical protein
VLPEAGHTLIRTSERSSEGRPPPVNAATSV